MIFGVNARVGRYQARRQSQYHWQRARLDAARNRFGPPAARGNGRRDAVYAPDLAGGGATALMRRGDDERCPGEHLGLADPAPLAARPTKSPAALVIHGPSPKTPRRSRIVSHKSVAGVPENQRLEIVGRVALGRILRQKQSKPIPQVSTVITTSKNSYSCA